MVKILKFFFFFFLAQKTPKNVNFSKKKCFIACNPTKQTKKLKIKNSLNPKTTSVQKKLDAS